MREYLFRGKKWDNSEWVYGDLIQGGEDGSKWILPIEELKLTQVIKIIPETVGQYIGIKDKNKRRIFENDILKGQFGSGIGCKSTKYKEFMFTVSYHNHSPEFHLDMPKNYGKYRFCPHLTDSEVVSNIHDNPELLHSL